MPKGQATTIQRVQRSIGNALRSARLDLSEGPLVIAVSGGPDSLTLLHALTSVAPNSGISALHVAHLDHGLRGKEGEEDAAFVQALAAAWNLQVTAKRIDVAEYRARHKKISLEMAAREVRYMFLNDLAHRLGASAVALGHTADDQAETVLHHVVRGAGLAGLQGMRLVSPSPVPDAKPVLLFRPLLESSREDTEAYCQKAGLEPRRDASNQSLRFTRNRLRRETIPALRKVNPSVGSALRRLAKSANRDADYLEKATAEHWQLIANTSGGRIRLRLEPLRSLHTALQARILLMACKEATGLVEQRHAEAAMRFLNESSGRSMQLPRGLMLSTDHRYLTIGKLTEALPSPYPTIEGLHRLNVPGDTMIPGWRVSTELVMPQDVNPQPEGPWHMHLDAALADSDLTVRSWRSGDRMQPAGMQGTKKLQDIFVDAKVPRTWRPGLPVVVSAKGIAWVVGMRVAQWALPSPKSEPFLSVRFELGG
jgi:tRNA(Ile)-lysidine synthase